MLIFKRLFLFSAILLLATACPPKCEGEYQTIDLGEIPQELLDKVPYMDGHEYSFKHNEGLEVIYMTKRSTQEETSYCDHGCCDSYEYDINTTELTTSYPIFPLSLQISNFEQESNNLQVYIGGSSFYIPLDENSIYATETYDNVQVNGNEYANVYKLEHNYSNTSNSGEEIFVDSLYYNYEKGILKIGMSNEEHYDIDE